MAFCTETIICASRDQARSLLELRAEQGEGFGAAAETVRSFLRARWELWGDGRAIVSSLQRSALMEETLKDECDLLAAPGTAQAIAAFAGSICGTGQLEDACGDPDRIKGFTAAERAVLRAVRRYLASLDRLGMVEPGEAAAIIAERMPAEAIEVMPSALPLDPVGRRLLESSSCRPIPGDAVTVDPPTGIAFGFIEPAGPAAMLPGVLARVLRLIQEDGHESVLVCASDAQAACEALAPALCAQGIACVRRESMLLDETDLGRAIACARKLCVLGAADAAAAVDLALNPWSGISASQARRFDAQVRSERGADTARMVGLLGELSPAVIPILSLLREGREGARDALAELRRMAEAGELPRLDAQRELRALDAVGDLMSQLDGIGASPGAWMSAMGDAHIKIGLAFGDSGSAQAHVTFGSLGSLRGLAPRSYDAVIICDVSAASFGARAAQGCLDPLALKLGCPIPDTSLDALRSAFNAAMRAASRSFICVMPDSDADRAPAYPSFPFEELLGELCGDPVDAGDIPEAMRRLDPRCHRIPEDDLAACIGLSYGPVIAEREEQAAVRGRLRTLDLMRFVPQGPVAGGIAPIMSPSSMEAYRQCPYHWFLERRIGGQDLDATLGPADLGDIAHHALARFYALMAESGMPWDDAGAWQTLLDEAFAEARREAGSRGEALTPTEALRFEVLRGQLRTFAERLRQLPPGYEVAGHEVPIRPEPDALYAGVLVSGRADRVDVDAASRRFAVIDYKGDITGYAAGEPDGAPLEELELPQKIQALVYAQALRAQMKGFACAAALYASYTARQDRGSMAGSVDMLAYDVSRFAGRSSSVMHMDAFLDAVEELMVPVLDRFRAGVIEQSEQGCASCRFCAHARCEARL